VPSLSINGLSVMEARIHLPRAGVWSAELAVDAAVASALEAGSQRQLTIAAQGQSLVFAGTVFRSDSYAQNATLRLVGGAHGMTKICKPRFYSNSPILNPVDDILQDAGETLAASADQNSLGVSLPFWTLVAQPAGQALTNLADQVGAVWRTLPDGSVFFGEDGFQASALTQYELIDYRPLDGLQTIASELPDVFPGELFNGFKVSSVEHVVNDRGSRARLWFET